MPKGTSSKQGDIEAPSARFCHPREEHLLPLHVCYGVACAQTLIAEVVFNQNLMNAQTTGFLWM